MVSLALTIVALLVLQGAAYAQPALAVGNHFFDPALSLTGGTGVSKSDEIPDPEGPLPLKHPPTGTFREAGGVAVDSHGDVYVSSYGQETKEGRIDIFNADGEYIAQIKDEFGPGDIG